MEQDTEIIELKFDGNGISPILVKASEVADMIRSFEQSLLPIIKENSSEINDDFVFISFEEISSNCISLKCVAHKAKQYVIPAYIAIATAFQTNQFDDLPKNSIEELRSITGFAKRHKCDGTFIKNGEPLATFTQDVEIKISDKNILRGDTTIYGKVLKAGGETPRVTLKINDSYTVSFEVKKSIAIQLATKLYSEIGLKGNAKWDKRNYKVLDFRADEIINIDENSLNESFKQLSSLFKPHIGGFDDFKNCII